MMLDGDMNNPEAARLARNAYMREWKKKNPEKVNAINLSVKAKRPDHYRMINRISMAKMRSEDPERFRAQRYAIRHSDPEKYLWEHARQRAKKLGVAFDLEITDIVIPATCPALGITLGWENERASRNKSSPSLDRMDPKKGYVRGNVYVISNRANHIKNNASFSELEGIARYMRERP